MVLYLFEDLFPGDYTVNFALPTGFAFTYQDEGSDDTIDSDPDQTTGDVTGIVMTSGTPNLTIDAGMIDLANTNIGDYVWEDLNGNGIQDSGEPGIENVVVTLTGTTGNGTAVSLTETTDANGLYLFEDLFPGDYTVNFALPTGFAFTYQNEGTDDTIDSDADQTTGDVTGIVMTSGTPNLTIDAGMIDLANTNIGDYVWEDLNGNGIQDSGEPGIENVVVTLTGTTGNGTAVSLTKTTDANGLYLFEDLFPGDYTVNFALPTGFAFTYQNEGSDDTIDSDADQTTGDVTGIVMTSGTPNLTIDAGMIDLSNTNLGDYVWEDLNGNGLQDSGEPGIENIVVTLTGTTGNGTAVSLTQNTDANGLYLFENLFPGDYSVNFALPTGFAFTYQDEGSDDTIDSDPDQTTGDVTGITMTSGTPNLTIDAGMIDLVNTNIGDYVWEDLNGNGLQDSGEPAIVGVVVTLTGTTGNGTAITLTETTDANGLYLFENLLPGDYTVNFGLPTDFNFTYENEGTDDELDSDPNPTTGDVIGITMVSGIPNLTIDAGMYQDATIGDFAFLDCDKDGIQDAGEVGLENVPVTLSGQTGNGTAVNLNATTAADGSYEFTPLIPGTYTLEFQYPVSPTGLAYSPQDQGGDDNLDSDVDGSGFTNPITVISNEENDTVDAGFMDVTPPTVVDATDGTVECDGAGNVAELNNWLSNNGNATATDNVNSSAELTWIHDYNLGDLSDECGATGNVDVTFTVTDECGNSSQTTATFTIEDTTSPTIGTNAQDTVINCSTVGQNAAVLSWLNNNGGAEASDVCGDVAWTHNYTNNLSDDCGATGDVEVTFTATDDCGNFSISTAVLTIIDPTPPTIDTLASDLTVECDGSGNITDLNNWLNDNGGASASDLCSAVAWSNDFTSLSDNCGATGTATVTFTATDNCGNETSTTATFTIGDTTPPSIDLNPQDTTLNCSTADQDAAIQSWLDNHGGGTASDVCGSTSWTHDYTNNLSDDCGATGSVNVTFTVTDDCGNTSTASATLTVIDNTNPTIDINASDLTVECDGLGNTTQLNNWLNSNGGASSSDDCSNVTWSNDFNILTDDCGATGEATVTFTATDDCGNSTSTTATFTIEDTTPPTIDTNAQDTTINCSTADQDAAILSWLNNNGGAEASDICGNVSWSHDYIDNLSDDCGASGNVVVTFTATDDCGNTSTSTATLTIQDITPPTIDIQASDETVECDGLGNVDDLNNWLTNNGGADASDDCSNVTWVK